VLDRASIDIKIELFAEFIAERVRWSMKQVAAKARIKLGSRASSA
jgi:hypothetical protein